MGVFEETGLIFLLDGINRRCGFNYYIVGSAIMLVLKMCFCPNVINILRKNLNVMQIQHLLMRVFVHGKQEVNTANCSKSYRNRRNAHTSTPQTSSTVLVHRMQYEPSSPSSELHFAIKFQTSFLPPLYNNSQDATLLLPTSTCKLEIFLKVKYHIRRSIYVFFNH